MTASVSAFVPLCTPVLPKQSTTTLSPLQRGTPVHNVKRAVPTCTLERTEKPAVLLEAVVQTWQFRGFRLRYLHAAPPNATAATPCILMIHGFGANSGHFRFNVAPLAASGYRVFSVDLIGFGLGAKPAPGTIDSSGEAVSYTFPYWSTQLREFVHSVVQPDSTAVYSVSNSIGCVAAMQAAVDAPDMFAAHVLISPSLRLLNVRKRSWAQGLGANVLQSLLSIRSIGGFFLNALAEPDNLRAILKGAYSDESAIDDELLNLLSLPAYNPGALEVFLAFIKYDTGPVPEDLLPDLPKSSTLILWGGEDGFEPISLGRALGTYESVAHFVEIPGVGHCAQDEAPTIVNEAVAKFFATKR